MKTLLASLVLAGLATSAVASPTPMQTPSPWRIAALTCGFKPFKPLSCRNGTAICVCDSDGNCQWAWVGC